MSKNKYVLANTVNNQAKSMSARVWKRTLNDPTYLSQSKPVIDECKKYYVGTNGPVLVPASIVNLDVITMDSKTTTCNLHISPKQELLNKRVKLAVENVRTF